MFKTFFLLALTLVGIFFGLTYTSEYFQIPRSELLLWTGIILGAYLIERLLKYLIQLPFKFYFEQLRRNPLAKGVQDTGLSLAYISFWLAIGFTPINAMVKDVKINFAFSNPIFLQISFVLLISTLLFSILWWITYKLKR